MHTMKVKAVREDVDPRSGWFGERYVTCDSNGPESAGGDIGAEEL